MYNSYEKRQTMTKRMAMILCVCLIAINLLSMTYVFTHTGHEHDQKGPDRSCATCIQIANSEKIRKQLSMILIATGGSILCFLVATTSRKRLALSTSNWTLITHKVRLNH